MQPELFFEEELCTLCGDCVKACPHGVHAIVDNKRRIRRELCKRCGKCVDACLTGALVLKGTIMTVDQVMDEVLKDQAYYQKSGGGITLSGGEPLMQPDFAKALLTRSKENGINTAIETNGYARWDVFEEILDSVHFTMYDIKMVDPMLHEKYCGAENSLILENLKRVVEKGKTILVRVPLIPKISDTDENLEQTSKLLTGLGIKQVELIPYHAFARDKFRALGIDYSFLDLKTQTREELERMRQLMLSLGIEAKIGV
jgi:pyruvate formate lyase activating enzyme